VEWGELMQALQLDFVPRKSAWFKLGLLLLPLLLLLALWLLQSYHSSQQQLSSQQARLSQLEQQRRLAQVQNQAEPVLSVAQREQQQAEIQRAGQVIERLTIPWEKLFDVIDSSVDDSVALLALAPDSDKQTLHISAEARDLSAMLAYQKRLNNSGLLQAAHVVSHQFQVQDPARAVRFEIETRWQVRDVSKVSKP
jgi:Tfp pilus assembly protein PilN